MQVSVCLSYRCFTCSTDLQRSKHFYWEGNADHNPLNPTGTARKWDAAVVQDCLFFTTAHTFTLSSSLYLHELYEAVYIMSDVDWVSMLPCILLHSTSVVLYSMIIYNDREFHWRKPLNSLIQYYHIHSACAPFSPFRKHIQIGCIYSSCYDSAHAAPYHALHHHTFFVLQLVY